MRKEKYMKFCTMLGAVFGIAFGCLIGALCFGSLCEGMFIGGGFGILGGIFLGLNVISDIDKTAVKINQK